MYWKVTEDDRESEVLKEDKFMVNQVIWGKSSLAMLQDSQRDYPLHSSLRPKLPGQKFNFYMLAVFIAILLNLKEVS